MDEHIKASWLEKAFDVRVVFLSCPQPTFSARIIRVDVSHSKPEVDYLMYLVVLQFENHDIVIPAHLLYLFYARIWSPPQMPSFPECVSLLIFNYFINVPGTIAQTTFMLFLMFQQGLCPVVFGWEQKLMSISEYSTQEKASWSG